MDIFLVCEPTYFKLDLSPKTRARRSDEGGEEEAGDPENMSSTSSTTPPEQSTPPPVRMEDSGSSKNSVVLGRDLYLERPTAMNNGAGDQDVTMTEMMPPPPPLVGASPVRNKKFLPPTSSGDKSTPPVAAPTVNSEDGVFRQPHRVHRPPSAGDARSPRPLVINEDPEPPQTDEPHERRHQSFRSHSVDRLAQLGGRVPTPPPSNMNQVDPRSTSIRDHDDIGYGLRNPVPHLAQPPPPPPPPSLATHNHQYRSTHHHQQGNLNSTSSSRSSLRQSAYLYHPGMR